MEQETDPKVPSKQPTFAHAARKIVLRRTIFCIASGLAVLLIALSARSSDLSAPTQRVPQFDNAHVKVWKSTIAPDAPLPLHRHDHGRVIIVFQCGVMKIAVQTGS